MVAVPGDLAPQSPSSIFPKGPQFLGRECGVTAFRAIAPQALPTTWLPGLSGWVGGGGGSRNYPPPRIFWLTASLVGLTEVAT